VGIRPRGWSDMATDCLPHQVGHIKLIDFGTARLLDSTDEFESFVGTAECVSLQRASDGLRWPLTGTDEL
jgi:serine/threonine protein kinase